MECVRPTLGPRVSAAVQLTVVVPTANCEPDAGEQWTGALPSTRSLADALQLTVAPEALVALIEIA